MHVRPDNPLIVQGDGKVLLETKHRRYEEVRDFLARFAELETSPEHLHTYRIHPLSLWNAASSGMRKDEIVEGLKSLSKFDIPPNVLTQVSDTVERYGLVKLVAHPEQPAALLRLERPHEGAERRRGYRRNRYGQGDRHGDHHARG